MSNFKKFFILLLVLVFAAGGSWSQPVRAASSACGVDGNTYVSEAKALAANVDVSYEGACQVVASESSLSEDTEAINFAGVLIEIGTTEIPTTIIVEDNKSKTHYTVEVNEDTRVGTSLSDWIPGDQIRVRGELNDNTDTVTASSLVNLSFLTRKYRGINGWITKIEGQTVTYTWMQREHDVVVTDRTRIVAGLKNPAEISDLKVGDRIRGRTFVGGNEAKIIVVLRRGRDLFMKIRTFVPRAELVRLSSTVVPTTIQVKILPTLSLRNNDVNNLIGTEGTLVTVNVTADTKLVRKYFGKTTLAEFIPGDKLHIVGRVNDDGTVDAKLIKNESIWQTNVFGHVGKVTEINTAENYFMMEWYPIHYLPRLKLKQRLQGKAGSVQAEMTDPEQSQNLSQKIRQRVRKLREKVKTKMKKLHRRILKKVELGRISNPGIVLDDVIEVMSSKIVKVTVSDSTVFWVGKDQGSFADLSIGDRVIVRGVRHKTSDVIEAQKVAILPSLPEIDEDLSTALDDVNVVVEEIITDDSEAATAGTDTEEVVETVE